MPLYYAIVKNFHNKDRTNYKLSGLLWAQRYRDALEEAREYQLKLNNDMPEDWVPSYKPYYVVVPMYFGDVRRLHRFKEIQHRRVTPRPSLLGSMNRLQPLEELGKDPR